MRSQRAGSLTAYQKALRESLSCTLEYACSFANSQQRPSTASAESQATSVESTIRSSLYLASPSVSGIWVLHMRPAVHQHFLGEQEWITPITGALVVHKDHNYCSLPAKRIDGLLPVLERLGAFLARYPLIHASLDTQQHISRHRHTGTHLSSQPRRTSHYRFSLAGRWWLPTTILTG